MLQPFGLTFNDMDTSQAIKSTHQLSVSFFTLRPTFLLQRCQQFLHGHGAEKETKALECETKSKY